MFCSKCGNILHEDDLYCKICGAEQNPSHIQQPDTLNSIENPHRVSAIHTWQITAGVLGGILILLTASVIALKILAINDTGKKTADKEPISVSSTEKQVKPQEGNEQGVSSQPIKPRGFQGIPAANSSSDTTPSAKPPQAAENTGLNSSYILAESNSRRLTEADLMALTKDELRLARNEIYARRGRMFKAQDLQDYFNTKDWYIPSIAPEDFKETFLTETEKYNTQLIKEYEAKVN